MDGFYCKECKKMIFNTDIKNDDSKIEIHLSIQFTFVYYNNV